MEILKKIKVSLQNNLPFVAYREPNKNKISAFFQKNDDLFFTEGFLESGFVFAPFDDENSSVLIPENQSEFIQEIINFNVQGSSKVSFLSDEKAKKQHTATVEKAIKAIKNKEFVKVVISRKEVVCVDNFDVVETFKKLVLEYVSAMVYVWFHPKVGLWLGATPETLLKITNDKFETMSLAGTQVYKGRIDVVWQPKEIDEQQVVTDYITSNLKPISDKVIVSKTETIKAGSLLHLQTKISGELTSSISDLIVALHPTPAVCGHPKKEAKQFVIDNEGYDRSFYTGFLGELNVKGSSELYVNLRCMKVQGNKAHIFVGGGITLNSEATKEWEETIKKTKTMKNVL